MYSDWLPPIIGGISFIWLCILSYFVLKNKHFLRELFPKTGERDIRKKFEEILKEVEKSKLDLSRIEKATEQLAKEGLGHIQKVAMVRFNPYGDTGGDQSFAVALLNGKGNGVVVTSLHSRAGTRVFAKDVVLGKATKHKFSKEEEQVVKQALNEH